MTPRARRAPVWLALLLALLALPAPARAHGTLRSAVPRSGARLDVPPRELRLTFSEHVELALAQLTLAGPDGRAVPLSPVRRGPSTAVLVADVVGAPSALVPGVYTVDWRVVGHDGHPVRGSYHFTILPSAAAAPATSPPPVARDTALRAAAPPDTAVHRTGAFDVESPLYAAVRWLALSALLGLVGTAAFGLIVLPAAARLAPALLQPVGTRARSVGVAASALLVAASLLRLVAQSAAVNGAPRMLDGAAILPLLASSGWGLGWMLQLGGALVALLALALFRRSPASAWAVAALCAVAAAVGAALSGHAAASEHRPALALVADTLHVLAAGGWVGTLLLLSAAGLPAAARTPAGERVPAAAALVSAFSPWALACAAVALATGATSAWIHLGTPAALWSTAYGRTLLVKLALLLGAVAAGAYNWRRVRPALAAGSDATRALSRSVAVELAAALAVVAVTAVLVATPL